MNLGRATRRSFVPRAGKHQVSRRSARTIEVTARGAVFTCIAWATGIRSWLDVMVNGRRLFKGCKYLGITVSLSRTPYRVRPCSLLAAAVSTLTLGCHAGQTALSLHEHIAPDAAAILDRYVEVTGGTAAYARIQNRVSEVRVVHVGMDFEDRAVTYEARPDKTRSFSESEAFGTTQSGIDGKLVWFVSGHTGPVVEEGEAREAAIAAAAFDRSAQWREHYTAAEYVGEEKVDGKSCHKVVLTPHIGRPETRFYDKESGLLVKIAETRLTSVGMRPTIPIEILIEDYRPVDGLLIAHRATEAVDMCGSRHETIYVTESIKHNVELPSDHFAPPPEVVLFAKRQETLGRATRPGCKPTSHSVAGQTSEDDGVRP